MLRRGIGRFVQHYGIVRDVRQALQSIRLPRFGTGRETALSILVVGLAAATLLVALYASRDTAALVVLPLAVAVCVAAGVVVLYACAGSAPAMIAFVFVLVFVNDALFRVREPGDLGLDWQNAMKLALWAGSALIGLSRLGTYWRRLLQPRLVLILTYLGFALLSSMYSASASYTFGTAFGMLGMLLLTGAASVTLTEKQFLLTFALSLCLFVLAGWAVYFVVPELGRSPFITADGSLIERICGLAGQANALGCSLATMLGVTFLLWYRGHCGLFVVTPLTAVGLFTLLAADSRTALLAMLVGIAAVLARRSLWVWGSSLLAASLGVILIAGVPLRYLLGFTKGLSRSGDPTELLTLTGRTEIWAFVWDKIQIEPWFGYGYNSSKFILPLFLGLPGLIVDEAHNTWLQNLLGTGIVGTLPLLALVVLQLVDYVRRPEPSRDLFLFAMLVWGITVAGPYGSTPTVMTLAVFASHFAASRATVRSPARQVRPLLSFARSR